MKSTTSKLRLIFAFPMRAMFAVLTAIFVLAIGARAENIYDVYNYTYTGAVQTFTVPAGVTSISVDAYGASGTTGNNYTKLGKGGRVQAELTVSPGDTLYLYVGEAPHYSGFSIQPGGWNGGGNGPNPGSIGVGYPGGGATDIRIGGAALTDRVIVAGGGGGQGNGPNGGGGHGGGLAGQNGVGINSSHSGPQYGAGGSQSSGGAGGYAWYGDGTPTYTIITSSNGQLGQGGTGDTESGGGGGGYYGGGGGADGGGGGGSSYTDPTLSSSVVHTQGVQTGSGQLTITVTQGDGPDAIRPFITVTSGVDTVVEGSIWTDAGATADTGETVTVVSSTVDINTAGVYTVTYSATDAAGNVGTATRTVNVNPDTLNADGTPVQWAHTTGNNDGMHYDLPQPIAFEAPPGYTVVLKGSGVGGSYEYDTGLESVDNVHSSLVSAGSMNGRGFGGIYYRSWSRVWDYWTRTYVAFARPLPDTTAPVITSGTTGTQLVENSGSGQTVYAITASDAIGADSYAIGGTDAALLTLTGNVVSLDANPDYEDKSSYSFTVTASDAAGNTSDPTTVTFSIINIVDEVAPTITSGVTGTSLAENSGSGQTVYTIAASDAIGVVSYYIGGTDAALLTLTGNVVSLTADPDYETKNTYSFTVFANDVAGNTSAATTVTFSIVPDTTAPVITLTGDATISLIVGETYTEAGATAVDTVDGDITGSLVISGTVNTSAIGVYSVNYNVSDTAGNDAAQVTRTVNVEAPIVKNAHEIQIDANTNIALDSTVGDVGGVWPWYSNGVASDPSNSLSVFLEGVRDADTHRMYHNASNPGSLSQTSGTGTSDYDYTGIPGSGNDNSAKGVVLKYTATEERELLIETTGGAYNDSVVVIFTEAHLNGGSAPFRVVTMDSGDETTFKVKFPYFTDNPDGNIYYIALTSYNSSDLGSDTPLRITALDTTAPVISVASGTDTVEQGSTWTDAGATADGGETVTASGAVNTSAAGTYTITYSATDAAGNVGTATRTVTVGAATVKNAHEIQIDANTNIALDSTVGDVGGVWPWYSNGVASDPSNSLSVFLEGVRDADTHRMYHNASNPGSLSQTSGTGTSDYDYTGIPGSGNDNSAKGVVLKYTATEERELLIETTGGAYNDSVVVIFTEAHLNGGSAPFRVVTMDSGDETTFKVKFPYFTDNPDGNIYYIALTSYNSSDLGSDTPLRITALDTTAPVISVASGTDTVEQGSTWTDAGATADGGETVTASGAVNTSAAGTYTITYSATDAAGNVGTATRTVTVGAATVKNTHAIQIDANTNIALDSTVGDVGGVWPWYSNGVASDPSNSLSVFLEGVRDADTHRMYHNASNPGSLSQTSGTGTSDYDYTGIPGSGNDNSAKGVVLKYTATEERELLIETTGGAYNDSVVVIFTEAHLNGGSAPFRVVTMDSGDETTFKVKFPYFTDNPDGNIYYIALTSYNSSDLGSDTPLRITALDTTAPVISVASGTDTVEQGSTWTDAGATADGGETVTASGAVNTSAAGTYTITYTATDAAGNVGTVTRTVNVVDTTAPVITLSGSASVTIEAGTEYTDAGATAYDTLDGAIAVVVATNVNTQVPGSYVVTYAATDAAGNTAVEVTRAVIVEDTLRPVITLTGSASVTIEAGSEYTDAGATASDTLDGTVAVVSATNVNTKVPGSYVVTYTATDAAGNAAVEVTRTVIVEDTLLPVITLTGSASVTIEAGSEYTDAGATASDTLDGTIAVVSATNVNTQVPGSYVVTYTATDAAGNAAVEVTRTVIVEDTLLPVITLTGSASVTIEAGSEYTDAGATASDTLDGTIAVVSATNVNTQVPGSYVVTYTATDAAGNAAVEVTRTVIVEDTLLPVITLTGSASVTIEAGSEYTDAGATASDTLDGTIAVVSATNVNTQVPGSYVVTYTATDAAGNTAVEVTRAVIVEDTLLPVITLTGSASVTIEAGSEYTDAGATASDTLDGTVAVVSATNVNTQVPGSYVVTYTATDAAGNAAVEVTRTVIVEDTLLPVITLTGSASVTIEAGSEYTDAGATASDTLDGTVAVVSATNVNTQVPGSYVVTYTATDAAGNAAVEVTRTVIVEDTLLPVITLTGSASVTIEAGSEYTDAGATASDTLDGTVAVVSATNVNTQVPGSYVVTYTATDAAGNAAVEVTRTVIVEDTLLPVITLTGSASVTIEAGSEYTDAGATASDTLDGTIAVVSATNVNTQVPGSYVVTYTATDAAGNAAVEVTRAVIVEDTLLPVITLTGSASVTIEAGSEYTDAGATASDTLDGTIAVVVDNKVNTQVPGSYVVTYAATDAAGNAAVEVARTVIVEETNTLPLVVTSISTAANGDVLLTWNSRAGQSYAILAKNDLNESDISLWDELDGNIESQGASTTAVISSVAINSITDTGKIFFRVRRQR